MKKKAAMIVALYFVAFVKQETISLYVIKLISV